MGSCVRINYRKDGAPAGFLNYLVLDPCMHRRICIAVRVWLPFLNARLLEGRELIWYECASQEEISGLCVTTSQMEVLNL